MAIFDRVLLLSLGVAVWWSPCDCYSWAGANGVRGLKDGRLQREGSKA
jgi:hypothetical protein